MILSRSRLRLRPRRRGGLGLRGRSWLAGAAAFAVLGLMGQPACAGADARQQDPYEALRTGQYEEAIEGLRRLASGSDDLRAHRVLIDALMEVGQYEEAEQAAKAGVARGGIGAQLANALGETLYARGKVDEAEQAFRQSIDGDAADANTARLNLAVLQFRRGQVAEGMRAFDAFIDIYNQNERLSAEDLIAVGTAVRHLGRGDPQLFHDAVKAYDEAIAAAANTGRPATRFEPRLLQGELFLEKYDSREAQGLFREVLEQNPNHPRALLDMAAAKYFDGSTEPLDLVRRSLEVNPNSVDARLLHARLLLDLEDYEAAEAEAEQALAVNASSLDALAVLAGVHYLVGDRRGYEDVRARAFALNPLYADFYNGIAELAVRQRKYADAVALAKEAIALDSASWWGWGILGINQLRTGELDEAKRNLDVAFAGDPYNVWIKNTLDLLDTFDQYRTVSTERFEFMLHGDEADVLAPYAGRLAEEAYQKLSERYQYRPGTPVRVEVYPSHADFSVRTVGLAGLGALGVSFGNLLAMDSPAARERGQFNWGSTLWHEITHTITLGLTDHRVPRWLTEGLSVLEERRARPGWGDDVTLPFLIAYKGGDILPVSQLNSGFVRPKYPMQIMFSYYQASLVAEMIEKEQGFDAILRMLRGYKDGKSDEQVFREVLRLEPEALDAKFDAYMQARFGATLEHIRVPEGGPPTGDDDRGRRAEMPSVAALLGGDDFVSLVARGKRERDEGRTEAAIATFQQAKTLFPDYVAGDSPYRHLARLLEEKGDAKGAAAELAKVVALDENDYDANLKLAELLEQAGDSAGAAAALERAVWISPYEIALHEKLAELLAATGQTDKVVLEREAVVALRPVDRAEALYQLARAHFDAGDRDSARRVVLRALEQAPSFQKAQELLLRIRR